MGGGAQHEQVRPCAAHPALTRHARRASRAWWVQRTARSRRGPPDVARCLPCASPPSAWAQPSNARPFRYADALEQLTTGRRISPHPKDWKCDDTGVTENLWLNLSTGHIGSGRQVSAGSPASGSSSQPAAALQAWRPCLRRPGSWQSSHSQNRNTCPRPWRASELGRERRQRLGAAPL